tara:strand:- start:5861 stop:6949 length:1089 start_codon:yes stop_codon:yes gene_type:complete
MKVLYIITGLAQGGAERVVCDLADKMYEKGHQVKIVYLVGDVQTYPVNKEIELINANLTNMLSLPKVYLFLSKIIKDYRPDVVHSHMVHANLLARLVRLIAPMSKLISTAHSSNEGGTVRMLFYRITHSLANVTTNVSREATLAFESKHAVPNDGMRTLYNGINLDKFKYCPHARVKLNKELYLNEGCKVILAVGRFSEAKNYPNLLKAIEVLKREVNYSFKLIIAGDGELRPLLESIIKEKGLEHDVILLGRRHDIFELMSAADLFVLPSKYEGFGLVVAEAMACECLVVATDCGGVAEVLNNSDFLVPPSNTVALKNKMKYALELQGKEKSTVINKNLKHVRENFSLEDIIEKWTILYHE